MEPVVAPASVPVLYLGKLRSTGEDKQMNRFNARVLLVAAALAASPAFAQGVSKDGKQPGQKPDAEKPAAGKADQGKADKKAHAPAPELPKLPAPAPNPDALYARKKVEGETVAKQLGLDAEMSAKFVAYVVDSEKRKQAIMAKAIERRTAIVDAAKKEAGKVLPKKSDVSADDCAVAIALAAQLPPDRVDTMLGNGGSMMAADGPAGEQAKALMWLMQESGIEHGKLPEALAPVRAMIEQENPFRIWQKLKGVDDETGEAAKQILTPEQYFDLLDLIAGKRGGK